MQTFLFTFGWIWFLLFKKTDEESIEESSTEEEKEEENDENSSSEESEDDSASKLQNLKLSGDLGLTIKMRGIPFSCNEKQIIDFFYPIKVVDIRIPLNEKGKAKGNAYVDFVNKNDIEEAMKKNKNKMKKRYIELFWLKNSESDKSDEKSPWEQKVLG